MCGFPLPEFVRLILGEVMSLGRLAYSSHRDQIAYFPPQTFRLVGCGNGKRQAVSVFAWSGATLLGQFQRRGVPFLCGQAGEGKREIGNLKTGLFVRDFAG